MRLNGAIPSIPRRNSRATPLAPRLSRHASRATPLAPRLSRHASRQTTPGANFAPPASGLSRLKWAGPGEWMTALASANPRHPRETASVEAAHAAGRRLWRLRAGRGEGAPPEAVQARADRRAAALPGLPQSARPVQHLKGRHANSLHWQKEKPDMRLTYSVCLFLCVCALPIVFDHKRKRTCGFQSPPSRQANYFAFGGHFRRKEG